MKVCLIATLWLYGMLTPAIAQFSVGPRVGVNASTLQIDERFILGDEEIRYKDAGSRFGFHLGAFARVTFTSFYLQPELLFTSAGGKVSLNSDARRKEVRMLSYNKIDIPVLVGVKFLKRCRLQAGPVFSYLISEHASDIDAFGEATQYYKNESMAYQAGLGIDIRDIYIDIRYEGSFSNIGSSMFIGQKSFDTEIFYSLFTIVVGYNLL